MNRIGPTWMKTVHIFLNVILLIMLLAASIAAQTVGMAAGLSRAVLVFDADGLGMDGGRALRAAGG